MVVDISLLEPHGQQDLANHCTPLIIASNNPTWKTFYLDLPSWSPTAPVCRLNIRSSVFSVRNLSGQLFAFLAFAKLRLMFSNYCSWEGTSAVVVLLLSPFAGGTLGELRIAAPGAVSGGTDSVEFGLVEDSGAGEDTGPVGADGLLSCGDHNPKFDRKGAALVELAGVTNKPPLLVFGALEEAGCLGTAVVDTEEPVLAPKPKIWVDLLCSETLPKVREGVLKIEDVTAAVDGRGCCLGNVPVPKLKGLQV